MKVIVSHDVDHLFLQEHLWDGALIKYGARAVMEWMNGVLTSKEAVLRLGDLFHKQWHHVDELMDFDQENGIPSTFFFGVNRGLGLNYSLAKAKPIIERVMARGFEIGVHGIEYKDEVMIKEEFNRFQNATNLTEFGVRMHYLRMDSNTLAKLSDTGYVFDSSEFVRSEPFCIGNMWELPLHIMDTKEFYEGKAWQYEKIDKIISNTKRKIENLQEEGVSYLSILFHDRYFCSSHKNYKQWYEAIVEFIQSLGVMFIGHSKVIKELV